MGVLVAVQYQGHIYYTIIFQSKKILLHFELGDTLKDKNDPNITLGILKNFILGVFASGLKQTNIMYLKS